VSKEGRGKKGDFERGKKKKGGIAVRKFRGRGGNNTWKQKIG